MKVIELFGGIGSPAKALKRLGIRHEVIDYVEFDKHAVASYNAINGTNFVPQDVTKWDKDIKCDYLHASTPCQAFSFAGKRLGADDHRGAPLWEATINIIKKTQPNFITLENVKGLLQAKHKDLLDWYINQLDLLGYVTGYKVLNSKHYGIPQSRERVFFISMRKEILDIGINIIFPKEFDYIPKLKSILEEDVAWEVIKWEDLKHECLDDQGRWVKSDGTTREVFKILEPNKTVRVPISKHSANNLMATPEGVSPTLLTTTRYVYLENKLSQYNGNTIEVDVDKLFNQTPGEINRVAKLKKVKFEQIKNSLETETGHTPTDLPDLEFNQAKAYLGVDGVSGTLRANPDTRHENKIIELQDVSFNQDKYFVGIDGVSGTLTTSGTDFKAKILNNQLRYRKLTSLECWRLMGFDDEDYHKAAQVCSTSQLCKQAGNSIVVNVMEEIFKMFFVTGQV